MGNQSAVITAQSDVVDSLICCPQAIFTSIRSPMGQGYRLVTTSSGIKAEEKIEITQRSPSHGSLYDPSDDAVGFISYPLGSGRHCVACCVHAGVEHTARGGLRVYTHIAVLENDDFEAIEANPIPVHTAMLERLRKQGPDLKPLSYLAMLSLIIPKPVPPDDTPPPPETVACEPATETETEIVVDSDTPAPPDPAIVAIADDLQAGRSVIIVSRTDPMSLIGSLLEILPIEARRALSLSAGLTYSPGRRLQLVVLPEEDSQLRRLIAGQDVAIHHISGA